MLVIEGRNVHDMYRTAMIVANHNTDSRPSRVGDVMVFDGPVTLHYKRPSERVIFHPSRDANPFFHLMESLWMIGGRNDVKWITQFNSNMAQYSDDGEVFHGAYGYRWRHFFGKDQLKIIAETLKNNPDDRRCVLQMWDADADLGETGLDFPCNLMICFRVSNYGKLDMTVYNRSNDLVWGATGANAVHMSFLQEVMASWIGVPVGEYWQVANNLHVYKNVWDKYSPIIDETSFHDPYDHGEIHPFPIVNEDIKTWMEDLDLFLQEGPVVGFRDVFFRRVATPVWVAWKAFKSSSPNKIEHALEAIENCSAEDWKMACHEWLLRRQK